MRSLFIALACTLSVPALAGNAVTYPISVPHECVDLANREGVPAVIANKYQAAKARLKLARLKNSDPLVRECRAAIERARVTQTQAVATNK
jgi:hypothetical protein